MKKLLPIVSFAVLISVLTVACNQAPKTDAQQSPFAQQMPVQPDTTGLAKFQLWKAQNELADVNQSNQPVAAAPQQAKTVVVYRDAPAKATAPKKTSSSNSSASSSNSNSNSGVSSSGSGVGTSTSAGEAKTTAKKGISKAAKGAIIGGVGGAIAGAVINKKNRGMGAVIGGVIGAGGGYAIGRGMDKKDGRVGSGSGTASTPPFSLPGILQQ
jgi:hypothetical protein